MHFPQIPTLLRLRVFARRRRQRTQEPGAEQFTATLKALREAIAEKPLPTRILVAEDNGVNRKVAQGLLSLLGRQFDFAENGKEAVELACTGRFGLIFMDCQMPEMDGFAATRAIRKWQEGRRIPIIALSASASPGDRATCLAAGASFLWYCAMAA